MKITKNQLAKLEALMAAELQSNDIARFIKNCQEMIRTGEMAKPKKCEATAIVSRLVRGNTLAYICKELYSVGVNDEHLSAAYRKIYKKYA